MEGVKTMRKKWRKEWKRAAVMVMAITFVGTTVELSAFAATTAESIQEESCQDSTDQAEEEEGYGTEIKHGTEDGGVIWTIYDSDADGDGTANKGDVLVLSGSGEVTSIYSAQYSEYGNTITTVKFADDSEITSIGKHAFGHCSSLSSVTIPEGVKKIDEYAFVSCSNLSSIELPEGLEEVASYAFRYCSRISSITIPEGVTKIGNQTFDGCSNLSSIELPESLKTIDFEAFLNCSSLGSITIPKGVNSIDPQAFVSCSSLKIEVVEENENYTAKDGALYNKEKSKLIIYPSAKGKVVIPKGVSSIGEYAFNKCSDLTSIELPEGVTDIGGRAFAFCTKLSGIELPEELTSIEDEIFRGCESLTSINIPNGVTVIKEWAFRSSGLTSVTIPNSVMSIEPYAFSICKNMQEFYYPYSLESSCISKVEELNSAVMASYVVNEENNTIELTITYIPEGMDSIVLPERVSGKPISAISYENGDVSSIISLSCTKHFSDTVEIVDETKHRFTGCSVCKKTGEIEEIHEFGDGTQACRCGYIPFSIETQPSGGNLVYGEGTKLSVSAALKLGTENIKYQWYENNNEIENATEETYVVPTGKNVSDYKYYCKISCGEYAIKSEIATVSIAKAEAEIAIESGKEAVTLKYSEEPVSLQGITKIGEGILVYEVTEGSDVVSVSTDGKVTPLKLGTAKVSVSMSETQNYKAAETKMITITVEKGDCPATTPDTPVAVENTVKKVSDVPLLDKWQWNTKDSEKTLPAGEELEVTAEYTGEDKEYYHTTFKKIIIIRAACGEKSDILYTGEGESAPTCIKEGKGHKECTVCHDVLESNITVPKLKHILSKTSKVEATCTIDGKEEYWRCSECTKVFSDAQGTKEVTEASLITPAGHTGGMATCTKKAVCDVCHEEYGELDTTNHDETEIKNTKSATCKETGYTGDTYCNICEQKISSGEEIAKLTTHTWDGGVVTKEATVTEKGVKTYTCSVCGETKMQEIPVVEVTVTPSTTPILSVTELPSATPIPSVTELPSTTPIPNVTELPSATPIPSVTEAPSATPIPSVTEAPSATPIPSVTEAPSATPIPSVTEALSATPIPSVTETPGTTPTVSGAPSVMPTVSEKPTATPTIKAEPVAPKKGTILTDKKTNAKYKIIVSGTKNGTVEYIKSLSTKSTKINVSATVKINGITYKVVSIAKNAFKNHKKLTKVTIGNNVKTIGANAFYGCKKLKTVSIGKNVTRVGEKAFYKCTALAKVTLPAKVKKIGKQSFYGCKKLKYITVKTTKLTKKNVGSKAFTGINKKATVKVPKSKVKAYEKLLKNKGVSKTVKVKK